MKYYLVDTFTDQVFQGNQAGVCILERELDDSTLQDIASENNLSETAFIIPRDGYFDLRWFTPVSEIDLCGHGTLASGFIISKFVDTLADSFRFETVSGTLYVVKQEDGYQIDLPARKPERVSITDQMRMAVDKPVLEAYQSRDLILCVEGDTIVGNIVPNLDVIGSMTQYVGVAVTSQGTDCDFVSRFFAPNAGIAEDPVTGSAHASLAPLWSGVLGKSRLTARQLSKRGGTLHCECLGDRVLIAGQAVLYLSGDILL